MKIQSLIKQLKIKRKKRVFKSIVEILYEHMLEYRKINMEVMYV